MLCEEVCPEEAIHINKTIEAYNAEIDDKKCIKCDICREMCPQNNTPNLHKPIAWYEGWSKDSNIRAIGSSGGIASELSRTFLQEGGEVLTCRPDGCKFKFEFITDVDALYAAAGSKYVKSDPEGIYKILSNKLRDGKKILMIALPCQIAAARKYVGEFNGIYCIDLICHGTPDPALLSLFLKSKGIDTEKVNIISFRNKVNFGLSANYQRLIPFGTDAYTEAFLKAVTYTENCYNCKFAQPMRTGDISLGDCWGSELSREERKKGVSLILCNSEKGKRLLNSTVLELRPTDCTRAIERNGQLRSPSIRNKYRERFLQAVQKGESFDTNMRRAENLWIVKNAIKTVLRTQ